MRTASGAVAAQLIRYEYGTRIVICHIGSSYTDGGVTELYQDAEIMRKQFSSQLSLFPVTEE